MSSDILLKLFEQSINDDNTNGDFTLYFEFNDQGISYKVNSFIFEDDHFDYIIDECGDNVIFFKIDCNSSKEICIEMIRYLHFGTISSNINKTTLKALHEISEQYKFKLEDICLKTILEKY